MKSGNQSSIVKLLQITFIKMLKTIQRIEKFNKETGRLGKEVKNIKIEMDVLVWGKHSVEVLNDRMENIEKRKLENNLPSKKINMNAL